MHNFIVLGDAAKLNSQRTLARISIIHTIKCIADDQHAIGANVERIDHLQLDWGVRRGNLLQDSRFQRDIGIRVQLFRQCDGLLGKRWRCIVV